MASENGRDAVFGFRPSAPLKARLDICREAQAKQRGLKILSYQVMVSELLMEAMDARGIPRDVPQGSALEAASLAVELGQPLPTPGDDIDDPRR